MRRLFTLALLASATCLATQAEGASHCTSQEKSVWACTAKNKVYELCSSKELTRSSGYLQYRAGRIGKVEFSYPANPVHPRGYFHHVLYARNAAMVFTNGGYEYQLFDALVGGSELNVREINGKKTSYITCAERNETFTETAVINHFKEVGINE